jgi:O-acetylhomoserine (thiol)-lyase
LKNKNLHFETLALHAGQTPDKTTGACAVPIYQTTSYIFQNSAHAADLYAFKKNGNIYSRITNPTVDVLEKRLTQLEGGVGALATASGMSAIFLAIHNLACAGDHIISSASLYGGTESLFRHTLPKMGIDVSFIPNLTSKKIQATLQKNTKAIYLEIIGNPKNDILDLIAIAEVAHKNKIPVICDNTFAVGLCQPFKFGIDLIVYSCTKWIGGHGIALGGAIIDSGKFNWGNGKFPEFTRPDPSYNGLIFWKKFKNAAFITKSRAQGMLNIGPCMAPQNAFYFLQGLETLPLRMQKHCENALQLAEWLKKQKKVAWVNYLGLPEHPNHKLAQKYLTGGFGSVFGFGLQGGKRAGEEFINSVKLASHLANVGDARTLVLHPASTTHQQLSGAAQKAAGISADFIRVSVGLENVNDLIADFEQAI